MNKKKQYYDEAERLYLFEYVSIDTIAQRLKLNRKTIMSWKDVGHWEERRKMYLKSKQAFHNELYELAKKLMMGISSDIDAGEKIDTGRMYALCRILPMFVKVKDYEDVVAKKEDDNKPKGLTAEVIAKIEEEILGIPRQNNEKSE